MTKHSAYRPDIDGLRAVAVLSVVLHHAGLASFDGGYVGVDVFFVISGFLIAGILDREISRGQFSLLGFYERRARRILPALFIVLLTTLIVGFHISLPSAFGEIAESALTTLLFVSNVYFWSSTDYFATAAEYRPLLHTWSLAVEEQFYIVFPLLLSFLARHSRRTLSLTVVGLLLVSLISSIIGSEYKPVAAFYFAPTRAWELLLGVSLALGLAPKFHNRLTRELLGGTGLIMIVVAVVSYDSTTTFPGLAAMLPSVGALLIIIAGSDQNQLTITTRLLSAKPLVFVGLISYSLYLWHWPIFSFLRIHFQSTSLPIGIKITAIIVAVVLSVATWRYVEQPFRTKAKISRPQLTGILSASTTILIAFSIYILASQGVPQRYSDNFLTALAASHDREPNRGECMGFKSGKDYCILGSPDSTPSIFVWGDSHAASVMSAISVALESVDKSAYLASHSACPPLTGVRLEPPYDWRSCQLFNQSVLDFIAEDPAAIEAVILVARWPLYVTGEPLPGEPASRVSLVGLDDKVASSNSELAESGIKTTTEILLDMGFDVVLLGTVPEIGWDVPTEIASAIRGKRKYPAPPTIVEIRSRQATTSSILRNLAGRSRVHFIQVADVMCQPDCLVIDQTFPVYVDGDHLSAYGARNVLGPKLATLFGEIKFGGPTR